MHWFPFPSISYHGYLPIPITNSGHCSIKNLLQATDCPIIWLNLNKSLYVTRYPIRFSRQLTIPLPPNASSTVWNSYPLIHSYIQSSIFRLLPWYLVVGIVFISSSTFTTTTLPNSQSQCKINDFFSIKSHSLPFLSLFYDFRRIEEKRPMLNCIDPNLIDITYFPPPHTSTDSAYSSLWISSLPNILYSTSYLAS